MNPIIIMILVILGIMGAMGGAIFYAYKKMNDITTGSAINTDKIDRAQDFLPFEDVKENIISLGGHRYRIIIECNSINYTLRTNQEREIIESSFQRFLNSVGFPFSFYIQTRMMDNTKILDSLKNDMEETLDVYPQLLEYANEYYNDMENLNNHIGNSRQKKKYIIIPFDEAINLTASTDDEKFEHAMKEIYQRAQNVIDLLSNIGIKSHVCNKYELLEMLYACYNRDDFANAEGLASGEFLKLVVEGAKNPLQTMSDTQKVDLIIYETQLRLKDQVLSKSLDEDKEAVFTDILVELNNLRDKLDDLIEKEDNQKNGKGLL